MRQATGMLDNLLKLMESVNVEGVSRVARDFCLSKSEENLQFLQTLSFKNGFLGAGSS
jgi:hypothetical protein